MDKNIQKKLIEKVKIMEEIMPYNYIIHRLPDFSIVYLSKMAKKNIGIPEEENNPLSFHEYFSSFFDFEAEKERIKEAAVRIPAMDNDSYFTFFQHVKTIHATDRFDCFVSSTKIFYRDEKGEPKYTLTIAFPMIKGESDSVKVNRLLLEKKNVRDKWQVFSTLTNREKQILQFMARNATSQEIAEKLFISENTVQTHRRNVKRKIGAKTDFDVISFAQSFDLI